MKKIHHRPRHRLHQSWPTCSPRELILRHSRADFAALEGWFCGTRELILRHSRADFATLDSWYCGTRELILRPSGADFAALDSWYCGTRELILRHSRADFARLVSIMQFNQYNIIALGVWGSVVVKALRYKSMGPGIDPRWFHWGFSPGASTVPCALGSTQPLKMSTRIFLGVQTAGA
jgi:hypothetical protein